MYCPNCGTGVDSQDARFCRRCGYQLAKPDHQEPEPGQEHDPPQSAEPSSPAQPQFEGHVPNHLVWAILATIFCCLPTGIVSIIYSAKVNSAVLAGDIEEAKRLSNNAKTWAWVSLGIGVGILFVFIILPILSYFSIFY